MTALIKALIALGGMVPLLQKFYDDLLNAHIENKVMEIKFLEVSDDDKRAVLLRSINQAKTDEEIVTFSVILHDYNSGRMLDAIKNK